MSYCPICDGFLSSFGHTCPPLWEVCDAEDCDDQDWQTIREIDAEEAAREYAGKADSDSGGGPHERTVLVRAPGSTDVKRFFITFDYSIDYYAREA
ncbi:hypothetical protein [Caballeronia sp. LZ001]|uniref:hypothetical protein n=1 Tax=Caballeronia sp. LZ001 TaxID=3038553 RepID=UPI0028542BCB|nr:hypothetical protein [Caballeronia sp. LZ001]MDR5800604.1 hypothetical protein [Caballeronia sp. LZ001]